MSSTRKNTHTTRPYRERGTPYSRAKLGPLQKHKDYSLRAASFNAKKAQLRLLRQKAESRNEDEFSFGMVSQIKARERQGFSDDKGVVRRMREGGFDRRRAGGEGEGGEGMGMERVRLLKTQDKAYLRTVLGHVRKERERLEGVLLVEEGDPKVLRERGQGLRVLGGEEREKKGRHTVFVDDEVQQKGFRPEEHFGTSEEGAKTVWNRPRVASSSHTAERLAPDDNMEVDEASTDADEKPPRKQHPHDLAKQATAEKARRDASKRKQLQQERLARKLEGLRTQEKELEAAERELDAQRDRMAGNVGGVNKNGVGFKVRERKR